MPKPKLNVPRKSTEKSGNGRAAFRKGRRAQAAQRRADGVNGGEKDAPHALILARPNLCPPKSPHGSRKRGWKPRPHQLALLDAARERRSTLLIAPTGAGKTLAGFLPSLISIHNGDRQDEQARDLFTLYVSPLKALAVDVARNLTHADRGNGPQGPHRNAHRRHVRSHAASASA